MPQHARREEGPVAGALRNISVEQDPKKLQVLIAELSRALAKRHERLKANCP